jgi:hypothetical protein
MVNAATTKKARERFYLDQFLNSQGITPTQIEEREEPDFLIQHEGRQIGVEVTQLRESVRFPAGTARIRFRHSQ